MYEEVNAQKHFMQKVVGLGLGPNIAIKFEGRASNRLRDGSGLGGMHTFPNSQPKMHFVVIFVLKLKILFFFFWMNENSLLKKMKSQNYN